MEAYTRLGLEPDIAISFFASKIPDLARFLASQSDLPEPFIPPSSFNTAFVDAACTIDHSRTACSTRGLGEVFINNDCTLGVFRQELLKSDFITLIHHEPPRLLPRADPLDMISIRTKGYIFHVFPKPSPYPFRATLDLLKLYEQDRTIYTWSPAGLCKILCDRFGWIPRVFDLKPKLIEVLQKDNVTHSDLSRKLFQCPLCWRARIFSAHVRPSLLAINHRAIVACIIHEAATHLVHEPWVAEMTQEQLDVSGEAEEQVDEPPDNLDVVVSDGIQQPQSGHTDEGNRRPARDERPSRDRFRQQEKRSSSHLESSSRSSKREDVTHQRHSSHQLTRPDKHRGDRRLSSYSSTTAKSPPRHYSSKSFKSDLKRRRH